MKTRYLMLFVIAAIVISTIAIGSSLMSESANQREIQLNQNSRAWDPVPDPICFVTNKTTSGDNGSGVILETCITLEQFEEMGCTKPMLEHILRYSNLLDYEVDGPVGLDWADCLLEYLQKNLMNVLMPYLKNELQ